MIHFLPSCWVLRPFVFTLSFAAALLVGQSEARADWVAGADGQLVFPWASPSTLSPGQAFETGVGFEGHVGYRYELGPVALRAEGAVSYAHPSFPIVRALVGGRLEGTGFVAPFARLRAGWGWVSYHSTVAFSAQPEVLWPISGNGFAYELGGGLALKPPGPIEIEMLVALNRISEAAVDDAPYVDLVWFSAGVGAAIHF